MSIKRRVAAFWGRKRARAVAALSLHGPASQEKTLQQLLAAAARTQFGRAHGFAGLKPADYARAVPVRDYEAARDWFEKIRQGQSDVAWPGQPLYLAKTSGTVSGAKYIPITRDSIRRQIQGARDALLLYMHYSGNTAFLDGRMMFLSGSPELETNEHGVRVGRLSGIVNHWVPGYLRRNQVPTYATNCIEPWETKIEKVLDELLDADLRLISGIPPWVQMLFERLEARTGQKPLERWPRLSLFVQGGVDFSPYRPIFRDFFGDKVDTLEVFPASEGFFGIQDRPGEEGLLLNLDYGIYYEFIPLECYGQPDAPRLRLGQVEAGQQYALVVSTNAGLWAYDIGDTVRFLSTNPYRIKVTGRVKHFISAFGEHVISEEVNHAMLTATAQLGIQVLEFTVAPQVHPEQGMSRHEWLVEFAGAVPDLHRLSELLDVALQQKNAYYKDLRAGSMLRLPQVTPLQVNASREYMRSVGKLGGQNKFPRLSNDRRLAEALRVWRLPETSPSGADGER